MALYQDKIHVKHSVHQAFDAVHNPGINAPFAGIYRCTGCGHEIGIAQGHTLPPEHPRHPARVAIQWQLLVFAEHKKD